MIRWLASWPRSGNTLLRVVLRQMFGTETWSIYDDKDFDARPEAARIIGHRSHGRAWEFAEWASRSEDVFHVKTHEFPTDDAPAIYVVRDGRSAAVSWSHYRQTFGMELATLEQIIRGDSWPGRWSDHVRKWSRRPGTLLVRYERLVAGDPQTLASLASFVGRPPRSRFEVSFDDLNRTYPEFFRSGSDERNLAELSAQELALFDQLHGETLATLGYAAPGKP